MWAILQGGSPQKSMREIGRYDTELQMFVESPKPLKRGVLLMWRHIAENSDRLGRFPEGKPAGEIALAMVMQTNKPIEQILRETISDRIARTGDY